MDRKSSPRAGSGTSAALRAATRAAVVGAVLLASSTAVAPGVGIAGAAPLPGDGPRHADAALLDAVKNGELEVVRAVLRRPGDARALVDAPGPDGATALHWAVYQDRADLVDLLLAAGASAGIANRLGVTPLSLACINGNAAVVEKLLEAGADPNAALRGGETSLMTASRTGNVDAVEALLGRGAEVNAIEGWHHQTALMWAAAEGHDETVQALIEHGADLHLRSSRGFTALLFAVRQGNVGATRALLRAGAKVTDALAEDRFETLARAKMRPPDFETKDENGRRIYPLPPGLEVKSSSALHIAVRNGHFELADVLLQAGADPDEADIGWTALHEVTWVRKAGVGGNQPEPQGSGSMDSLELVRRLVAAGADVNARMTRRREPIKFCAGDFGYAGATPFLLATKKADLELMRLLLSLGADPRLTDDDGVTPLLAAAGVGTHNAGEDAGTEPEVLEVLQFLLDQGHDINAVDRNGETAMHGAAYRQFPLVVKFLAEKGARIEVWNREDKFGWTPLTVASGVQRCNNIQGQAATADAIREVMGEAPAATAAQAAAAPGR